MVGGVVGDAGVLDFALVNELGEALGGLVGAGEPIGPMDQQDVEMVGVEKPERFLGAVDEVLGSGVVVAGRGAVLLQRGDIDAALSDDFDFVAEGRFVGEDFADGFFDLVEAVDFSGVDGRNAELETGLKAFEEGGP